MSNVRVVGNVVSPKTPAISTAYTAGPHVNPHPFVATLRPPRQAPALLRPGAANTKATFHHSGRGALEREPRTKRDRSHDDPLDPSTRHAAQMALPLAVAPEARSDPEASVELRAKASLEDLLPALVRRVAWSGDGRRGTMRLELGAGPLAGATLVIHADEGRVKVELRAPAGIDAAVWRERIGARLQMRGIAVDSVEVE